MTNDELKALSARSQKAIRLSSAIESVDITLHDLADTPVVQINYRKSSTLFTRERKSQPHKLVPMSVPVELQGSLIGLLSFHIAEALREYKAELQRAYEAL